MKSSDEVYFHSGNSLQRMVMDQAMSKITITQTVDLKCHCAVDFDSCVALAFYLYHVLFQHHLLSFLTSVLP
jgi:hypothetical protein